MSSNKNNFRDNWNTNDGSTFKRLDGVLSSLIFFALTGEKKEESIESIRRQLSPLFGDSVSPKQHRESVNTIESVIKGKEADPQELTDALLELYQSLVEAIGKERKGIYS